MSPGSHIAPRSGRSSGQGPGVRPNPNVLKPGDLISISEISRTLGIARATALRLVKIGDVPGGFVRYRSARKEGSERWAVRRDTFSEWLAKQGSSEGNRSSR